MPTKKSKLHNANRDLKRAWDRTFKPYTQPIDDYLNIWDRVLDTVGEIARVDIKTGKLIYPKTTIKNVTLDGVIFYYENQKPINVEGVNCIKNFRKGTITSIAENHAKHAKEIEADLCRVIQKNSWFLWLCILAETNKEYHKSLITGTEITKLLSALKTYFMPYQDIEGDDISVTEFHKKSWFIILETLQAFFPHVFDKTTPEALRKKYERWKSPPQEFPIPLIKN